jgi:hypothetical protein
VGIQVLPRTRVESHYPIRVAATNPQPAPLIKFEVKGSALGFVPVVISGLTSHLIPTGHGLWLKSGSAASFALLDQGSSGANDFWQTNYDRVSGTYEIVYNVEFFENVTMAFGSVDATWAGSTTTTTTTTNTTTTSNTTTTTTTTSEGAPFSWGKVPLYWYSADPWDTFDDDTAAYAAEHPVVVPNGNHMRWMVPWANKQEDKLVQTAEQIKGKNTSAKVLFYLNTMMDWTQYSLHHDLTENHSDYWNVNISGCATCHVCMRGQPIFNLSIPEMRQKWLETMSNALSKSHGGQPLFHGVFGDRTNPLPKGAAIPQGTVGEKAMDGFWQGQVWWNDLNSAKEVQTAVEDQCKNGGVAPFQYHWKKWDAWNQGHTQMVLDAQAIADSRAQVFVANNNASDVGGRHWEQWCNDAWWLSKGFQFLL